MLSPKILDRRTGIRLFDVGVAAFDRLRKNQKRALLALVGDALKRRDTPCPDLTAPLEGAVAAVFRHVRDEVELEIAAVAKDEPWNDDTSDSGCHVRIADTNRILREHITFPGARPSNTQGDTTGRNDVARHEPHWSLDDEV